MHHHGDDDGVGPAFGRDGGLDRRVPGGQVGERRTALLLHAGVLGVGIHGLDDLPHAAAFDDEGMVGLARAEVGQRRQGVLLQVGVAVEGRHGIENNHDAAGRSDGGLVVGGGAQVPQGLAAGDLDVDVAAVRLHGGDGALDPPQREESLLIGRVVEAYFRQGQEGLLLDQRRVLPGPHDAQSLLVGQVGIVEPLYALALLLVGRFRFRLRPLRCCCRCCPI